MSDRLSIESVVLRARMLGAFQLSTVDGRDLTPRGAKQIGLLALLLLSPRGQRPRDYLMDKLWSDRQQTQATNSLKGALSDLRKALHPHEDLLLSKGQMVSLRPGAIVTDLDDPEGVELGDEELLEGLAIRDPEFVSWLRDRRNEVAQKVKRRVRPVIRLRTQTGDARIHGEMFNSWVSTSLADWCAMQIVAADGEDPNFRLVDDTELSRLFLDTQAAAGNSSVAMRMRLVHERTGQEMWSQVDAVESDPGLLMDDTAAHRLINVSVDRTLFHLGDSQVASDEALFLERGALGAIRMIFRNEGDDLERAREQLSRNHELRPAGLYLAWSAYTLAFFKAERVQSVDTLRDEAEYLASRAIELDPHGAMTLALCSYVFTYLLARAAVGLELADRSIRANRSNPLAWSFKCAALYTMGQHEEAFQCAARARAVAGDGPYRYAIETYYCIAAMLSNRIDEAINAGEIAALMKPGFRAPLRCLCVLYAARGDEMRLAEVIERLRRVEPEFSMSQLLDDNNYPSAILRTAREVGRGQT